jgi:hypothetical protein
MVYDVRRARCVLFGGQGQQGFLMPVLGDTWTYAERQWRPLADESSPRPKPRCGHMLGFDETAEVTVLFGGVDGEGQSLGDTWLFDGSSWQPVRGAAPPARRYAAFAYDPDLKGCVLNGGSADDFGRVGFGDTWLFRERTWTRLPRKFDTALNDDHGLAYHRAAKQLIMFGGLRGRSAVYVREPSGWRQVKALPVPARHQCAPLAWDEGLNGVVYHGGETGQGGRQFDTTWLLQLPG